MNKLSRQDLMSLELYAEKRLEYRAQIMEYKKKRQLALGDNARLYFENKRTIQYQIQEVLRVEKTFDAVGIEEELEAYNPLIPDGHNLKATFMLEFPDAQERIGKTVELRGIEYKVWLRVEDCDKVYPIANEDLARAPFFNAATMVAALKNGARFYAGIEHEGYFVESLEIAQAIRESLTADFDHVAIN